MVHMTAVVRVGALIARLIGKRVNGWVHGGMGQDSHRNIGDVSVGKYGRG